MRADDRADAALDGSAHARVWASGHSPHGMPRAVHSVDLWTSRGLHDDNVASAITGGSRPKQLHDNTAAPAKSLASDTLASIDEAPGDAVERAGSLVGEMSAEQRPTKYPVLATAHQSSSDRENKITTGSVEWGQTTDQLRTTPADRSTPQRSSMDTMEKWFRLNCDWDPISGSRGREFKSRQPDKVKYLVGSTFSG